MYDSNFVALSELCLNPPDDMKLECYIYSNDSSVLTNQYILGSLNCFIVLIGILGNVTTIAAVSLSAVKKRPGVIGFRNTGIFILNLSLVELTLLICTFLPSCYVLFVSQWPFGEFLCKVNALFIGKFYCIGDFNYSINIRRKVH